MKERCAAEWSGEVCNQRVDQEKWSDDNRWRDEDGNGNGNGEMES